MSRRVLALLGLLAAAPAPGAWALRVESVVGVLSRGRPTLVAAGEAVVRFDPAVSAQARASALQSLGARVLQENVGSTGWTHVGLPPGMSVATALSRLGSLPGVLAAHPNHVYRPVKLPNDPQVSGQYHLSRTNAFAAWDFEVGTSSLATVAVIDAGIQAGHPDLQAKIVAAEDCSGAGCAPEAGGTPVAACEHATRVSGVAAAATNNGAGVAGMSWGAKLASLRVLVTADCNPDCSAANPPVACGAGDTQIANAIDFARSSLQGSPSAGRVVVNMSLGDAIPCSGVLQTAVTNAVNAGLVLVAAAGNDSGPVNSPGNCAGVIPVGATDINDNVAGFSSNGPELAAGGLVAPGVGILTTDLGGGYTSAATGTSFASPQVAGTAALILSARPAFSPAQVQNVLRASADSIAPAAFGAGGLHTLGNVSGAGRLDAFRALKLAIEGTLGGYAGDQKAIAFPNPFKPGEHGTVTVTVPAGLQGSPAQIRIYTLDGQFVRELHGQTWDGRNEGGTLVASGTYVFVVKTDAGLARGRIGLLR